VGESPPAKDRRPSHWATITAIGCTKSTVYANGENYWPLGDTMTGSRRRTSGSVDSVRDITSTVPRLVPTHRHGHVDCSVYNMHNIIYMYVCISLVLTEYIYFAGAAAQSYTRSKKRNEIIRRRLKRQLKRLSCQWTQNLMWHETLRATLFTQHLKVTESKNVPDILNDIGVERIISIAQHRFSENILQWLYYIQ